MLSCTTDRYDTLYSRWLERPGALLDIAQWKPGQTLLDLCGGTGAVSREALRRGALRGEITLVDLNPRCPDDRVRQIQGQAERIGWMLDGEWDTFDVIVCRQAVAYLSLEGNPGMYFLPSVRALLKPGGRFALNSFNEPRWALKNYVHEGRRFLEASGYLGRHVVHAQVLLGAGGGLDVTHFRWYPPLELGAKLRQTFPWVERQSSATSTRWVCTKQVEDDQAPRARNTGG